MSIGFPLIDIENNANLYFGFDQRLCGGEHWNSRDGKRANWPPVTDAQYRPRPLRSRLRSQPPSADELKRLEADLSPEEAEVLLHHGTESAPSAAACSTTRPTGSIAAASAACRCFAPRPSSRAARAGRAMPPIDAGCMFRAIKDVEPTAWCGSRPAALRCVTATRATSSRWPAHDAAALTASIRCRAELRRRRRGPARPFEARRSPVTIAPAQSGILSCFFHGFSSFFPFRLLRARAMRRLVSLGMMTSSI